MRSRLLLLVALSLLLSAACNGGDSPVPTGTPSPTATAAGGIPSDVTGTELTAQMTGAEEVPGPGDPDGTGTARFIVDVPNTRVCFEISVQSIGASTAAHIHPGAAGVAGPPDITLVTPDEGGTSSGCASAPKEKLEAIIANPSNFYVNVHNAEFPPGAVRGQLTASGATPTPAAGGGGAASPSPTKSNPSPGPSY